MKKTTGYLLLFLVALAAGDYPLFASPKDTINRHNGVIAIPAPTLEIAENLAAKQLELLFTDGFLKAQTDSITDSGDHWIAHISTHQRFYYHIGDIRFKGAGLPHMGMDKITLSQPLRFGEFNLFLESLLTQYSIHGYPFARIEKQDIQFRKNIIHVNLEADPGEVIVFDTLSITGDARLSSFFLENYLEIRPGNLFNEKLVNDAGDKLSDLDFVDLTAPVAISFSPGKAKVALPLRNRPSNRFDGLAGLAGGGDVNNPVRLTGILNLYLSNAFALGEHLDLAWQGPGSGTQLLNLSGGMPYPLRLPLETEVSFSLHKQDTSWLQVQFKPGILFRISPRSRAGVFWHYTQNNLISTPAIPANAVLPSILDFRSDLYGLEYRFATRGFTRQLLSPGSQVWISTSAGTREIRRNSNLPDELYQGVEKRQSQFNLETRLKQRWQTGTRSTFSVSVRGAYLSGKDLPVNMMYRLGGFKTLRGFDELSLIASSYALGYVDFRFFTAENSFFSFFANGGWLEQKTSGNYYNDFPVGVGTGLNLQTQAGIFSINLALGALKESPALLRNAKVHVGYISSF